MAYIAFTLCFAIGVGGSIYLVMNNHPYWAVAILIITAGLQMTERGKKK